MRNERMGNGAISINITVYPDVDGAARYDKCLTRTIDISHLGGLDEMDRLAGDTGTMVTSTIAAMLYTMRRREAAEAKAAAEVQPEPDDGGNCEDEPGEVECVIVVDNTEA